MPRRTTAIAPALSVLALGSPLITGCTNQLATQYFGQGVEKYDAGNYQGAIADFAKVIEIDPQSPNAYYNRGNAKKDLGDYQGAIVDYDMAIEINPQYGNAYNNRGAIKDASGDRSSRSD